MYAIRSYYAAVPEALRAGQADADGVGLVHVRAEAVGDEGGVEHLKARQGRIASYNFV